MIIKLERAKEEEAHAIFEMQKRAFTPLLEIYKDYETNPANEALDRVLFRINRPNGGFYKILLDERLVGAVCVYWKEGGEFWISPIFIDPEFQGKGIAQKAIESVEALFPKAKLWALYTILQEKRNCYLY